MIKKILPSMLISTNVCATSCLERSMSELLFIDKNASYNISAVIVTSPHRSYLYSFPDSMCKMKSTFLIKGDIAKTYLSAKGFNFINYYDKKGNLHVGWIDAKAVSYMEKEPILDTPGLTASDFSIWHNGKLLTIDNKISDVYSKAITENHSNTSMFDDFRNIHGVDYKIFHHEGGGLYIESSNINYLALKRDFDDYRMTTIQLTSLNGISSRGIFIGVPVKYIHYVYGKPSKIEGNNVYYRKGLSLLSFEIDKKQVIKKISVNIIPK